MTRAEWLDRMIRAQLVAYAVAHADDPKNPLTSPRHPCSIPIRPNTAARETGTW